MPRKSTRNNRNKSRRRKNAKKSYKVSVARLASKKIDSLLERRIQEIARQEQVTLICRRWCAGGDAQNIEMQPALGEDAQNKSYHTYKKALAEPTVFKNMISIQKIDVEQPVNNPQLPAPDQGGAQQGMEIISRHGKREKDLVKIKAISLEFRLKSDYGMTELADESNSDASAKLQDYYARNQGHISFEYKVVMVQSENNNVLICDPEEVAKKALPYDEFGYSSKLDPDYKEIQRATRYKTLMKGKVNCSPGVVWNKLGHDANAPGADDSPSFSVSPVYKEWTQYKKFNKPIEIQYAPNDQDGIEKVKHDIFLVYKSNVKAASANPLDTACAPRIACISKVYYTE